MDMHNYINIQTSLKKPLEVLIEDIFGKRGLQPAVSIVSEADKFGKECCYRDVSWDFPAAGYLDGRSVSVLYSREIDKGILSELPDGNLEIGEKRKDSAARSLSRYGKYGADVIDKVVSDIPEGEHVKVSLIRGDQIIAEFQILVINDRATYIGYRKDKEVFPGIETFIMPDYSGFLMGVQAKENVFAIDAELDVTFPEPNLPMDPSFGGRRAEDVFKELFEEAMESLYPEKFQENNGEDGITYSTKTQTS